MVRKTAVIILGLFSINSFAETVSGRVEKIDYEKYQIVIDKKTYPMGTYMTSNGTPVNTNTLSLGQKTSFIFNKEQKTLVTQPEPGEVLLSTEPVPGENK